MFFLLQFMFYDRSCMFAGEPGPANLSPRTYPSIDSSAFHALTPALITHLDHAVQVSHQKWIGHNFRLHFVRAKGC